MFVIGTEVVKYRVDAERNMSLAGKMTNDRFLPFERVVEMGKQDRSVAELTQKIVKSLPTLKDVEDYLILEFGKVGAKHAHTRWEES